MCSGPLYLIRLAGLAALLAAAAAGGAEPAGFRFEAVTGKSLGLWEGDRPVLVYNHGPIVRPEKPDARPQACYFHPVYGLDAEVLTEEFPRDHTYHRGMYWAWPHITIGEREYELWTARGELQQSFVRWLAKDAADGTAMLAVENGWFAGGKQLVREQVELTVQPATQDGRVLDITLTWTPIDEPLTIRGAEGKSYGGFNLRFGRRPKTAITVPESAEFPGGAQASGRRIMEDLVVTRLPWVDFVGDFERASGPSGAAIFVHPEHRDFPPTWMARHYGLVSVGWPGVEPQTFPPGKPITCRYRLWIHRGAPSASEIQKQYDQYRAATASVE